jgi:hypothetical protein
MSAPRSWRRLLPAAQDTSRPDRPVRISPWVPSSTSPVIWRARPQGSTSRSTEPPLIKLRAALSWGLIGLVWYNLGWMLVLEMTKLAVYRELDQTGDGRQDLPQPAQGAAVRRRERRRRDGGPPASP